MTDSAVVDPGGSETAAGPQIERWQIWHTYSTYCLFPIEGITLAGRRLVESGLAVAALASTGQAWWASGGLTKTGRLDDSRSEIKLPEGELISAYTGECLGTAMRMEEARHRVFPWNPSHPPSYVRAFLEPMTLTLPSGGTFLLYPQVLLDSSGVILTEFRTLSPPEGTELRELIDQHVNLFQHECTAVGVPRGPLRWFIRGVIGPMHGWRNSRREKAADARVRALETRFRETPDAGDFAIPLVRIFGDEARTLRRPHDPPLGLRFLGQVIEIAIGAAVLSRADVLGRSNAKRHALDFPLGGAWSGRPAVYLLWSSDQPVSARARVEHMADDLAKIMWRTMDASGVSDEALGRNLRQFDDYAAFVNSALYLWLCEQQSKVSNAEDPNLDSVVCEKQVQVEHVEALWARHLRLRALADEPKSSLTEIARLEQEFWQLTTYPRESSRYGEIWQFLEYAGQQLGVPDMRMHVQEGLRLRSAMLEEQRSRREYWFGGLLSVLLGIGASETLTDRFLVPLLKRGGYDFTGNTFWLDVASLASLVVAAAVVWWFTVRRKLLV